MKLFASLDELPEEVKAIVDQKISKIFIFNVIIHLLLFNLSDELKEQGVIFTDIFTAVREHSELVQKYFMTRWR